MVLKLVLIFVVNTKKLPFVYEFLRFLRELNH